MDKLQSILDDLEKEAQAKKVIVSNVYNNQPELISISSDSASITKQNQTNDAYYSFTVNLQRPALGVKTIQLLKANVPQATALSFTNGELLFPYYRIKTQENIAGYDYFTEEPNIDNLYYVRLLPSYYPSNIIPNAQLYGFNKTFNNYVELSNELAKACANDLLYTNLGTSHFIPNDCLISYNTSFNKFQFTGNNTTTAWTPPTWLAGTYQVNAIVRYSGTNFISETNNNTETPVLPFTILPWDYTTTYNAKDIVSYAGINYTARGGSVNAVPPDTLGVYWIYSEWDPTYDYALFGGDGFGTPVTYGGVVYTSAVTSTYNQGNRPDISPAFWTSTLTNWSVYTGALGFSYLIAGYDDPNVLTLQQAINEGFLGANPDFFYGAYGLNNIMSIATAPVTPGKTLAKRLGFTWNGIYSWPGTNSITPFEFTQGSSLPIFLNRFRPIPNYQLIVEELGDIPIPNNNPFTSTTYIAENFCNLVYTSILSIISNITTASSLDSTARRNLLWLLPLNCGQLGIAFSDAYIDTPLTKINNDIFQINIELRNELDEPFYISNNGISTFLLKLTY
jgi:hypothetical protein